MILPQIHQELISQKKAQVIVYNGVNPSKELPIRKKYSKNTRHFNEGIRTYNPQYLVQ